MNKNTNINMTTNLQISKFKKEKCNLSQTKMKITMMMNLFEWIESNKIILRSESYHDVSENAYL